MNAGSLHSFILSFYVLCNQILYDERSGSVHSGLPHTIQQFKFLKISSSLTSVRRRHTFFTSACARAAVVPFDLDVCFSHADFGSAHTDAPRLSQQCLANKFLKPKSINFVVSRLHILYYYTALLAQGEKFFVCLFLGN